MVNRGQAYRSTVEYGSLSQAGPARFGLQRNDRLRHCSECNAPRRTDVNGVFYTHLSGLTRAVPNGTEWLECAGSRRSSPRGAVLDDDIAIPPPDSVRATWDENLARMQALEELVQVRCDRLLTLATVVGDVDRDHLVRSHRRAITSIRAENQFFEALAVSV